MTKGLFDSATDKALKALNEMQEAAVGDPGAHGTLTTIHEAREKVQKAADIYNEAQRKGRFVTGYADFPEKPQED